MKSAKAPAAVMITGTGAASICTPLTILFVILKVVGAISWSWFWVLSPLIFSMGFAVVFIIGFLILTLLILGDDD